MLFLLVVAEAVEALQMVIMAEAVVVLEESE
jgi:hypothetical protein